MSTITTQVYSGCTTAMAGDVITISVNQTLKDHAKDLMTVSGPKQVNVRIDGPQFSLTPADITGVYPAPDSEESADDFLPHIALSRRTLPWERIGLNGKAPWLALVLFSESQLRDGQDLNQSAAGTLTATTIGGLKAKDPAAYSAGPVPPGVTNVTPVSAVFVKNKIWNKIRPQAADLPYLTHIKQTTVDGQDSWAAVVICNRLPFAGANGIKPELHTAFLISLEGRTDLDTRPNDDNLAGLAVLHHWTFRPSKGGDFEQVIRSIALRPNGGVLRFGNLPSSPAQGQNSPLSGGFDGLLDENGFLIGGLPHTQEDATFSWRGPLRPFAAAKRSNQFAIRPAPEEFVNNPGAPHDYSHASAFEMGRLAALANGGILEDLRNITIAIQPIDPPVAINKLPDALQKRDWVVDPAWSSAPWEFAGQQIVKDNSAFLANGITDIGGIQSQVLDQYGSVVLATLGQIATPVVVVGNVDIQNVTDAQLGVMFGDVLNAVHP